MTLQRPQSLALRWFTVAVLLVAASTATGCGAHSKPQTATRSTFRNDFLQFDYPSHWKPSVFTITETLHFMPMLYLSPQPVRQPCHKHLTSTVCNWPLSRLQPGSALIVWENRAAPGWTLRTTPGASTRVGGRPAKRRVDKPGQCVAIGADETIELAIERPLQDNWTAFTACLRGPDLAAGERDVAELLASTRFVAP